MGKHFRSRISFAVVATLLVVTASFVPSQAQVTKQVSRSFAASGRFVLVLDNKPAGMIHSVEGGSPQAVVLTENSTSSFLKKRVGGVGFEQISMELPLPLDPLVAEWISTTLRTPGTRRSGQIVALSFDLKIVSALDFTNALISEIEFPTLDGASKEAAYLTVKLVPTSTKRGTSVSANISDVTRKSSTKQTSSAHFSLSIDGMDTKAVAKIESFVVKQGVTAGSDNKRAVPGRLDVSNLKIVVSEVFSKPFYDWLEDFLMKGNNGEAAERKGSISFLDPSLQNALFKVGLGNLGIVSIRPTSGERGDQIRRVQVEMYVESVELLKK